ncbi:MAG: DoxX family membrane protein [Deltaproteobacteria bacterium]|nr:DoxX family membrane protein [Deltaproteobacteria bacterium]MBW2170423.1 DoxX family membrane protein [Deltaproteobacteria bacterium]MBW2259492.1 DoxX family membrane protein [Deltaproteobacteria bacterium]
MQSLKNILVSLWTYRLVRVSLGTIFVWAGLAKLLDVESFANIISTYELVPENLLIPVAFGLPAVELAAGLCLIFDVRGSLTTILALLVMFAFVLWFGILKDLDIDCGCFSADELAEHSSLRLALYRDLGMFAAGLYLFWWRWATRSSPRDIFSLKAFVKRDSSLRRLRQTAS